MLQHDGHAADAIDVGHVVLAAGLGVSDVRHLGGDAIEVFEIECNTGLVGNCEQVQYRIRAASECIDDRDRVLERLLRHDVARIDTESGQIDDGLTGATGVVFAALIDRWR